jgi:DNA-binding transcriptional MerR regulator
MRIAELSRRSGVPVATIKYYMREGLVPQGERTMPNQASYDDSHLRRLRLARALIDVGGLPVAVARDVLHTLDDERSSLHDLLGKAQYAATARKGADADTEEWRRAEEDVHALIARRGWIIRPEGPALHSLTEAIAMFRRLGQDSYLKLLGRYADAAEQLAAAEVAHVVAQPDIEGMAEAVVVGTVLGDALMAALRRLAQEAVSSRMALEPAQASATVAAPGTWSAVPAGCSAPLSGSTA